MKEKRRCHNSIEGEKKECEFDLLRAPKVNEGTTMNRNNKVPDDGNGEIKKCGESARGGDYEEEQEECLCLRYCGIFDKGGRYVCYASGATKENDWKDSGRTI